MADKENDKPADDNKIDHYVRMGLIANGKHAQVCEVQEENTSNRFAMKLLLPEAMKDPVQVATLKFEGKVAQSLDHPNIVKWFATVNRKTNVYLILELFKAPSIKSYINNDHVGVQMRLRKLIDSTCLALQHMHERGWLHLDVKPDNILMSRSSEVRVIDFSLSEKVKGALGKMFSGGQEIGGTLTYIAPETIRKEGKTQQTDIYSLGITIYECLTATTPFKGSTPKDLLMKHLSALPAPPSDYNKNVTPEMDRMVLRMLAKKLKDRHKSMQEVMSEFRNIQIFKEDPEKLREEKVAAAKAAEGQQSLGKRLDSRTDHKRQEAIKDNPELAAQMATTANPPKQPIAAEPAKPVAAPKPAPAPVQQPVRPAPVPMPQPMMPGFAPQMPFAPMPQMPGGGFAPMPGYPGMPPGMPGYPPGYGMMPGMPQMQPGMPQPMMQPPGFMPGPPQGMPPQMTYPQMPGQFPGQMPAMPPNAMPLNTMPAQPPAAVAPPAVQNPAAVPQPARPNPPAQAIVPRGLQRPAPPPVPQDAEDLPTMDELPDVF